MYDKPIVKLNNVHKTVSLGSEPLHILKNINLAIARGKSTAIVGPSGSGKSSLLHLFGLLTPPSQGTVEFDGIALDYSNQKQILQARRTIGFIFQDAKLIPQLNVLDNVCVPLSHRWVWPSQQREIACENLAKVGLSHRLHHYPKQLSGGEIMRVAVARALCFKPKLLLADEPTGNLDSRTGEAISNLLFRTIEDGTSLVLVTHHQPLADMADVVVHVKDSAIDNEALIHRGSQ